MQKIQTKPEIHGHYAAFVLNLANINKFKIANLNYYVRKGIPAITISLDILTYFFKSLNYTNLPKIKS
jgi:hypothetical protein